MIFNINYVLNSFVYSFYFIYILTITQSFRNIIKNKSFKSGIDDNYNFLGFFTFFILIINYIHYNKLTSSRDDKDNGCDCDNAKITEINNNIKQFQLNTFVILILNIVTSFTNHK